MQAMRVEQNAILQNLPSTLRRLRLRRTGRTAMVLVINGVCSAVGSVLDIVPSSGQNRFVSVLFLIHQIYVSWR